ncbi:tRNA-(ms[2]io[6]A)-hydroxylase [Pseudenhygromyxa sp. WMMC2535]|uniref:tRNA isopentenyl-2-thiomethyl-A-37 hydroxylase MiaE n=1 Tax=Pseudenhygromyxa sp. WMMC2535 TaxID=2712867 RepID=UPI0015529DDA|nr:tRNA isopentenyl-2-thiomethyl-A-37 hydroxylase MiaE [Pseudenhygromyxa sp. WMMC2535]NVB38024.1 tRNA-(ms[2]io[6]A)-hydroxylase [Pseudenhygromyxa sp. WMMC2535]
MLHLASASAEGWAERALAELDALLLDHAHCEKKAASTALSMIFRYPEHACLAVPMSELAREELRHFEQVVALIRARGGEFCRQKPSPYAAELMTAVRKAPAAKLLDTLLCCALIEARSCERMQMIARALAARGADDPAHPDHDLFALYDGLLASEARHHATYVELARRCVEIDESSLQARLAELAAHEAAILASSPGSPVRMHT